MVSTDDLCHLSWPRCHDDWPMDIDTTANIEVRRRNELLAGVTLRPILGRVKDHHVEPFDSYWNGLNGVLKMAANKIVLVERHRDVVWRHCVGSRTGKGFDLSRVLVQNKRVAERV